MKLKLLLYFSFLLCSIGIKAQQGGKSVYDFLNLPYSARISGLGGVAPVFKDNDINLAISNPALINEQMNNNLTLSFLNYFAGIKQGYAGYSLTNDKYGSFLAGMQFINYGEFIKAESSSEITGTFTAGEYALNLGWGKQLDSSFSFGTYLKTIYSHLEQYNSLGFALDIEGIYFVPKTNIALSMMVRNAGLQVLTYNGQRQDLPFDVQFGASQKLKHAPLRFSLVANNLQNYNLKFSDPNQPSVNPITGETVVEKNVFFDNLMRHMIFGTEILPTKNITLSLGYNYRRRAELKADSRSGTTGLSFGLGIKIKKLSLNYSRATYHIAGASNHITVSSNLSAF